MIEIMMLCILDKHLYVTVASLAKSPLLTWVRFSICCLNIVILDWVWATVLVSRVTSRSIFLTVVFNRCLLAFSNLLRRPCVLIPTLNWFNWVFMTLTSWIEGIITEGFKNGTFGHVISGLRTRLSLYHPFYLLFNINNDYNIYISTIQ